MTESQPTIAADPFNDLNADVILRTNDSVDFYVPKHNLSSLSPFFKHMFELPDGDRRAPEQNPTTHPIIPLDDKSRALRQLLIWCDPRCVNTFNSLADLELGLDLAAKYDVETVISRMESMITSTPKLIEQSPLRAFALGARYQLKNVIRDAARLTLTTGLDVQALSHVPALRNVQGNDLYDLLAYHNACRNTVSDVFHAIGRGIWSPFEAEFDYHYCTDSMVFFLKRSAGANEGGVQHTCERANFGEVEVDIDEWAGGVPVALWFKEYLEFLQKKLMVAPLAPIPGPSGANPFLTKASACRICRPLCHSALDLFNCGLANDIGSQLYKIPLGPKPASPAPHSPDAFDLFTLARGRRA